MAVDASLPAPPADAVAARLRTVAAGLHGGVAKLTVSLQPVGPTHQPGQDVPLSDWPRAVERAFFDGMGTSRIGIEIRPIGPLAPDGCLPEPCDLPTCDPLMLAAWRPRAQMQNEIVYLWRFVMPAVPYDNFMDLCSQIARLGRNDLELTNQITVETDFSATIAIVAQIERTRVSLRQLTTARTAETSVAAAAWKMGQDLLHTIESAGGELPVVTVEGAGDAMIELKKPYGVTKRKAAMARATISGDAPPDAIGRALGGAESLARCLERMRGDPAECARAPGIVLQPLDEVLKALADLYLRTLAASDMGDREANALADTAKFAKSYRAPSPKLAADPAGNTHADVELGAQRLRELQHDPDIARLFNTAIDFALGDDALAALRAAPAAIDARGLDCRFVMIRVAGPDGLLRDADSAWSYAKMTFDGTRPTAFSPATREEVALACCAAPRGPGDPEDCELIPIIDGVRMLSTRGHGPQRCELSSVNPRDAAHDLDTRMSLLLDQVKAQKPRPDDFRWPVVTPKSRAIRLIDHEERAAFGRDLGLCVQAGGKDCTQVALDARDLSLGVIYDAAMQRPGDARARAEREWQPFSAARIEYIDPRPDGIKNLDEVIARFYRDEERARHQRATAALLKRDAQRGGSNAAVGDGVLLEFTGEQMGTDPDAGDPILPGQWRSRIDRVTMMQIDRRFRRPDAADAPWPARFGWGYHIAAREVFVGGGSTDDATARVLFETPCAAVPRLNPEAPMRQSGHRLLRTEPVARPQILLDGQAPTHRAGSYRREYLPSDAAEVVLRSELDVATDALRPIDGIAEERFVLVPGGIDLEMLRLHGRAHGLPQVETRTSPGGTAAARLPRRRPADALAGIDMPLQMGGFPVLVHEMAEGPDGPVLRRRTVRTDGPKPGTAARATPPGSGVFRPATTDADARPLPYWPDPLCDSLALRLQRVDDRTGEAEAGGQDGWTGRACLVRVREGGPDPTPILLVVSRASRSAPLTMAEAGTETVAGVRCRRVDIKLPPGDAFDLVAWSVPDLAPLALTHEVASTLATLCLAGPWPGDDSLAEIVSKVCESCDLAPDPCERGCGPAGLTAPDLAQLMAAATWLRDCLCERPYDPVSTSATIRLHHAIDRTTAVPIPDPHGIRARRGLADDADVSPRPGLVSTPDDAPRPAWATMDAPSARPDATDILLAGWLAIDPGSTEGVEIHVSVAAPISGRIDDGRGRPRADINAGIFRAATPGGRLIEAADLVGFAVAPEGPTRPQPGKVLLAHIDRIPPHVASARDRIRADLSPGAGWRAPTAYLALHDLFRIAHRADAGGETRIGIASDGTRITIFPVLAFTAGRLIEVRFRAKVRHGRLMALRRGVAQPASTALAVNRFSETPDDGAHRVVLSASARPAMPVAALKSVPGFLDEDRDTNSDDPAMRAWAAQDGPPLPRSARATWTCSARRTTAHLTFERPGYTGSDDERFALILSPRPSTYARHGIFGPKRDGRFGREWEGLGATDHAVARLRQDFIDPAHVPAELLGRLTEYAEKGDRPPLPPHPSQAFARLAGLFPVPISILADLRFDALGRVERILRDDVGYVADAQLPIHPADQRMLPRYWPVDLVTYLPRFNLTNELWYIDVGLDPLATLDPHLRFGIVRWTACAPRDLATSRAGGAIPVTLLPARRTIVTRRTLPEAVRIDVAVEGRFAIHDSTTGYGPETTIGVVLSGRDSAGRTIMERRSLAAIDAGRGVARAHFDLAANMASLALLVKVEEKEERPSATLLSEPTTVVEALATVTPSGVMYIANLPVPP